MPWGGHTRTELGFSMRAPHLHHTRPGTTRGGRLALAIAGVIALAAALLGGASPATAAAEEPNLTVTSTSSAATAAPGKDVVFTVTVKNSGTSTLKFDGLGEYEGAGASIGLWIADPAACTVAISSAGAGGSENVCFETFDTGAGCVMASFGGPSGWAWYGYVSGNRPTSLAPGASYSCKIGVHVLKGVVAGAGLALEVWDSPNGYEHTPGEHHADTSFTVLTVPAAGTQDGPKVTGTATAGKTLKASAGFLGPWNEKLTYRWLRNGAAIAGATASSYTLAAADLGKQISVRVTGQNTKGLSATSATFTSPTTAKVAAAALKTATPTISGSVGVAKTLTAKAGTWTTGTTFTYQWLANGKAISKATKSTYKLTTADAGKKITVKVTGKKAGYTTVAKTSKATAKVATVKTPTISGTVVVGKKLTAKPGVWTTGTTFTYQWYANGTAITGATKSTFTLTKAQKGKTITVKVTGKKTGYATVALTLKATAAVK